MREWVMSDEQQVLTIVLLLLLVLFYALCIYFASRNCQDFLYAQKRYRNLLLSAFYIISLSACLARIFQYLYLVLDYCAK